MAATTPIPCCSRRLPVGRRSSAPPSVRVCPNAPRGAGSTTRRFRGHWPQPDVRWHVERTFAWLQTVRRVLVRYERLLAVYSGFVYLAAIVVCLRRVVAGQPPGLR